MLLTETIERIIERKTGPATKDPATTDPATTDPVTTDPVTTDPVTIFEESLPTIFSDPRVQHGEPGEYVLYKNEELGDFKLKLETPDPSNISLFAHYIWNAALQTSELLADAKTASELLADTKQASKLTDAKRAKLIADTKYSVAGKRVLEVGAGAGLPGIIAVYCDAVETVLSDYPAEKILKNIQTNLEINLSRSQLAKCSVIGHEWGKTDDELCTTRAGAFDKIIASDCFWKESQYENLAKSVKTLLARDGELFVISGFHNGRDKVVGFFDAAEKAGLVSVEIKEKDIEGVEREWVRDRGQEDPVERKRWLVIGVFKHKDL